MLTKEFKNPTEELMHSKGKQKVLKEEFIIQKEVLLNLGKP